MFTYISKGTRKVKVRFSHSHKDAPKSKGFSQYTTKSIALQKSNLTIAERDQRCSRLVFDVFAA